MPPRSPLGRDRRRCFTDEPIPPIVRRALAAEREWQAQFTVIVDHLRPELTRAAHAAGVGAGADDVVSEVIARRLVRSMAEPPTTFATPDAYQHLRASLLVSVRNAARNWLRDNRRTIAVNGEALLDLMGSSVATSPIDLLVDDEESRALQDAVARLTPAEARVAQLVGVEEFSAREAARILGVPKSTVQDAWSRAQRSIRSSVERYLDGRYCEESAPYLALLDIQRRAERDGSADRPLDEAVGSERAVQIARHVYGAGATTDGCSACRLARARERAALRSFLPPVIIAPPTGRVDSVREAVLGLWDATIGALGRLVDDAAGVLAGVGGGAAGLGGGKAAALLTSATLAVGASTVAPRLIAEHSEPRPARTVIVGPTSSAVPATVPRRTVARTARPTPVPAARKASRPPAVAQQNGSAGGGALAEFTPGP